MRDPIARAYVGPDFMYQDAYHAVLQLLPMRSLMSRADDGRMTLVGLEVEVGARRSRQRVMERRFAPWRPYLRFRSDAGEISERRADLSRTPLHASLGPGRSTKTTPKDNQ